MTHEEYEMICKAADKAINVFKKTMHELIDEFQVKESEPEMHYKPLEEYSWEEIKEIIDRRNARTTFKIGDTKSFKFMYKDYHVRIIDFTNRGGIVFDSVELMMSTPMFEYAHSDWDDVVWEKSDLKNKTLQMIYDGMHDLCPFIDTIDIPSTEEVIGENAFALYRQNKETLVKGYHGSPYKYDWWLRSKYIDDDNDYYQNYCFWQIDTEGDLDYADANSAFGVAPIFTMNPDLNSREYNYE